MPRPKGTSNQRAERDARRESRKHGYEYRPTSARVTDEAKRLNDGFALMAQENDGDIDSED